MIPKKANFQKYNLGAPAPRCPLCINNANAVEHFMEKKFFPIRQVFAFVCERYKVRIRVDDPFVGKWEQALHNVGTADGEKAGRIPCPNCDADMRFFATSLGYMKAACPKKGCGCTTAAGEASRKPLEKSLPEEAARGEGEAGVDKVYTPEKPGSLQ